MIHTIRGKNAMETRTQRYRRKRRKKRLIIGTIAMGIINLIIILLGSKYLL